MSKLTFTEFKDKYIYDCQLGEGGFGKVCRILCKENRKYFAVKKVTAKKKQLITDAENTYVEKEIVESYTVEINNYFGRPMWEIGIVMELAKCSLRHFIRMRKPLGSLHFVIEQVMGLIHILFILQKENIAHRDIKPDNILIFENNDGSLCWKLADFGLAAEINELHSHGYAGSYEYASPSLKKKFNFPAFKIQNNPFKDDVYSLGITLLETITGMKKYNAMAYEKLNERCSEKKFVSLIDMMLEEQEEKRPCFKQLMILIEKDFENYSQSVTKRCAEFETLKILAPILKKQLEEDTISHLHLQTEKTMLKKEKKHPKILTIETGKRIMCVTSVNGIIFCGEDNGSLFLYWNDEVVECGQIHSKFVSNLLYDSEEYVWSSGGDNVIKKWNVAEIQKSLESDINIVEVQEKTLFKTYQRQKKALQISNVHFNSLSLPPEMEGISKFLLEKGELLCASSYKGYLYLKNSSNHHILHFFSTVITDITPSSHKNMIYICTMEGHIKSIDLNCFRVGGKGYFQRGGNFVGVWGKEGGDSLWGVGGDRTIGFDANFEKVWEGELGEIAITWVKTEEGGIILGVEGGIFDLGLEKIGKLEGSGWNCLGRFDDDGVIAGSFMGTLAIISF